MKQMIAIGDETGNAVSLLFSLADIYEAACNKKIDLFLSLLEPLTIILLGILIAGLIIALYLPIFNLGSAI